MTRAAGFLSGRSAAVTGFRTFGFFNYRDPFLSFWLSGVWMFGRAGFAVP
jgi:hypothetical protein